MFLKQVKTGHLVEVIDLTDVINPYSSTIRAKLHIGEQVESPDVFLKTEVAFPSGEPLPLCWTDGHYREHVAA